MEQYSACPLFYHELSPYGLLPVAHDLYREAQDAGPDRLLHAYIKVARQILEMVDPLFGTFIA